MEQANQPRGRPPVVPVGRTTRVFAGLRRVGGEELVRPVALVAAILIPVSLTLWATQATWSNMLAVDERLFERAANDARHLLDERLHDHAQVIRDCQALFVASRVVESHEWYAYLRALEIERHPSLFGLGFSVPRAAMPTFLDLLAEEGDAEVVARISEYSGEIVLVYAGPTELQASIVGTDLAQDDRRREACETARDSGELTLSRRITLYQEAGVPAADQHAACMMIAPLYSGDEAPSTVEERRRRIVGYISGVVVIKKLIAELLAEIEQPPGTSLSLELHDGSEPLHQPPFVERQGLSATESVSMGGRVWRLVVSRARRPLAASGGIHPLLVLISGLVATLMLSTLVWALAELRRRAQRHAEAMTTAFHQARAHSQTVVDSVTDAIITFDGVGRIVSINRAAERLLDRTQASLISLSVETLIPGLLSMPITGLRLESELHRPDGSRVPVDLAVIQVDVAGQILRGALVRDISARVAAESALRSSEERYRDLFETASDLIQSVAPDGRLLYANRAWCETLGFAAADVPTLNFFQIVAAHDLPKCTEYFRRVHCGETVENVELDLISSQGRVISVEGSINSRTVGGEVVASQGILRNVTHLREVDRLKRTFVSTVSHELRTPLTSIRGSLGLLASGGFGELPPRTRELIEIANRNATRLTSLINDILDLERMQTGKLDIRPQPVAVQWLFDRALEAAQGPLEQQRIRVAIEPTTMTVLGDPDRLVQVLVNLLSNAAKFSPQGSLVSMMAIPCEGRAELQVIDQGRGVPEDKRTLIFEPFQQVEASDARQEGGTGLGLAICRGIVEQHGGEMGVRAGHPVGSVFWLRLPLAPA